MRRMKTISELTFCFSFGLLIVSAGTDNYIGLIAAALLFGYTTALCIKLEPESRR